VNYPFKDTAILILA